MSKEKIIVALDYAKLEDAEALMKDLEGLVTYYKIGFEFFIAHGWKAVELAKKYGNRVFLDLKLHDIPNTVSQALDEACRHEIDMVNVHALGGAKMMSKAAETVAKYGDKRPKLIAVTVLTSHSAQDIRDLGIEAEPESAVLSLAQLTHQAGLDGVVCSPQEIGVLRAKIGPDFCLVTPGIRPKTADLGDQQRVCTPGEAVAAGADYLVIGRPIRAAEAPRAAAQAIIDEIGS